MMLFPADLEFIPVCLCVRCPSQMMKTTADFDYSEEKLRKLYNLTVSPDLKNVQWQNKCRRSEMKSATVISKYSTDL